MKRLLLALFCAVVSMHATAVIYTFDVSDVSWSPHTGGTTENVIFWYEFTDTADLNALHRRDLLGMGVITQFGSESAIFPTSNNINGIFGISEGIASLKVSGPTSENTAVWDAWGEDEFSMQVGQGSSSPLSYRLTNGTHGFAARSNTSHTYYSLPQEVPLPAAAWLFLSALLGMVGLKRYRSPQA